MNQYDPARNTYKSPTAQTVDDSNAPVATSRIPHWLGISCCMLASLYLGTYLGSHMPYNWDFRNRHHEVSFTADPTNIISPNIANSDLFLKPVSMDWLHRVPGMTNAWEYEDPPRSIPELEDVIRTNEMTIRLYAQATERLETVASNQMVDLKNLLKLISELQPTGPK